MRKYVDLIVTVSTIAVIAVVLKKYTGWQLDLGVALAAIAFVKASR